MPLPRSAALVVARKDLALEGRTRDELALMGLVAVLIMLLFRVAAEGHPGLVSTAVWVTLVFSATAALARSFHAEADHGTLDLLLASPASASALYLGKALASFVVALAGAAIALVVALLFFGTAFVQSPAPLAAFLVLGALGLAAQTAFFSALSARSRARAALFPVLVIPLLIPLMLWAARGTAAAAEGAPADAPLVWLDLAYLAVYDALFLSLYFFLAPRALDT
jgi:heme exporter protein B